MLVSTNIPPSVDLVASQCKDRTFAFERMQCNSQQVALGQRGRNDGGKGTKGRFKNKKKVKLICLVLLESYSQRISGKLFLFLISFLTTRIYSKMTRKKSPEFILLSPDFLAPILPNCLMKQRGTKHYNTPDPQSALQDYQATRRDCSLLQFTGLFKSLF